jgi:cysteine synthase A
VTQTCVRPESAEAIDRMIHVPNAGSYAAMQMLEQLVGRRSGGSTGTDFHGALQIACEMHASGEQGSIVTLACDSGDRCLGTYYSDDWLKANGHDIAPHTAQLERALRGDGWQPL